MFKIRKDFITGFRLIILKNFILHYIFIRIYIKNIYKLPELIYKHPDVKSI